MSITRYRIRGGPQIGSAALVADGSPSDKPMAWPTTSMRTSRPASGDAPPPASRSAASEPAADRARGCCADARSHAAKETLIY